MCEQSRVKHFLLNSNHNLFCEMWQYFHLNLHVITFSLVSETDVIKKNCIQSTTLPQHISQYDKLVMIQVLIWINLTP